MSLYDGSSLVAMLSIGSGYSNAFSTLSVDNGSYTQIDYLAGGTNPAPGPTPSANSYQWIGPVAGFWNAPANWDDTTAGQNPALLAPGADDPVMIGAAANGAAQVIIGNGNASALTLGGETLLDGVFNVGAGGLTVADYASAVLYAGSSLAVSGDATFGYEAGLTLNGGKMAVTVRAVNGQPIPQERPRSTSSSADALSLGRTPSSPS